MELTPNILLDNLKKNFSKIVGEALVGYYQCWKSEQDITTMIRTINENNDNELSYLLSLANTIQYGKSYFASEVIKHLTEIENIKTYAQLVLPYIREDNEQVYNENNLIQKGGLPPILKSIFALLAGLTINSCDNATAFAVSIAGTGQNVAVYYEGGGEFPRAKPVFTESIDVNDPNQLEKYSMQFRTEPFPQNSNYSVNVSEKFKESFVENINKPFLEYLMSNNEKVSKEFSSVMDSKVKHLNGVIFAVHESLETMCRSFVEIRDPLLPIRLFELFNDEYERNKERASELERKLVEEKRSQLKAEALLKLGAPPENPDSGWFQTFSDLGNIFSFGSPQQTQAVALSSNTLSVNDLIQAHERVDEGISKEIELLGPEFKTEATQIAITEALTKFNKEVQSTTDNSNLEAYFSAICSIEKTYYAYDRKTGLLTIVNPARSRFHLMILVKNVIDYYDKITREGIKLVDNKTGEVTLDIPDTADRINNLQSLHEKAQIILEVLNTYNRNLMTHLSEGSTFAGNIDEFFQFLTNTWTTMKEPIKEATLSFPITSRREESARKTSKEEFDRDMKQRIYEGERSNELRMMELRQKISDNTITAEESEVWNQYVGLKVDAVLDPVKIAANGLVNTAGDITINTVDKAGNVLDTVADKAGQVLDTTTFSITRNIYGIAWAGMSIAGALLLLSCITGCGPVGAIFTSIVQKKKRDAPALSDAPAPSSAVTPYRPFNFTNRDASSALTPYPYQSFNFTNFRRRNNDLSDDDDDIRGANTSLSGTPLNPTRLSRFASSNYHGDTSELTQRFQSFGLRGGLSRRANKRKLKKTRKHKKRKTRKGQRSGKRKYTRYRKS